MPYQACAGQLFRKSLARSFLELNAPVSIDLENVNLEDVSSCSHSSTAVQPYGASRTGGAADVLALVRECSCVIDLD